jgi:hypothetical protein
MRIKREQFLLTSKQKYRVSERSEVLANVSMSKEK